MMNTDLMFFIFGVVFVIQGAMFIYIISKLKEENK